MSTEEVAAVITEQPNNETSTSVAEQQLGVEVPAPSVSSGKRTRSNSAVPLAAALGTLGVTIVGGILRGLLRRPRKDKRCAFLAEMVEKVSIVQATPLATRPAGRVGGQGIVGIDLSPFGSPVGGTPARMAQDKAKSRLADDDCDSQSDNASVRDQRQSLVDAAQLQKALKQMQELAEENRKMSAFLAEHKASAEKLAKLEQENLSLRNVTSQLEEELKEIKTNAALPRTGAELEAFKSNVRMPSVARSVCSNDDTVGLGASTASVDGAAYTGARVQRNNMFKQLLASLNMAGTPSAGTSQPTTPRASGGGAAGDSARSRKPAPEEAAAIGQAVYQLLDQFQGRMM